MSRLNSSSVAKRSPPYFSPGPPNVKRCISLAIEMKRTSASGCSRLVFSRSGRKCERRRTCARQLTVRCELRETHGSVSTAGLAHRRQQDTSERSQETFTERKEWKDGQGWTHS